MKLSATWSTVSVAAALSLVGAAIGFTGCTVTSGTIDDDGGTVKPNDGGSRDGTTTNPTDSGTDVQVVSCEGNNQQEDLVSAECQTCLEGHCCTELKGCFNVSVDAGDVTCSDYADCIINCNSTDSGDVGACESECASAAGETIANAYQAILNCGAQNGCSTACGISQ